MRPRQNRDEAPLPPLSFDATDRPLRRDVARLGAQLGKVLRDCGTPGLFDAVERARLSARKRRKGDADEGRRLEQQLTELDPTLALDLVRAFSAYFGAVNMAEQVHRMRRRIDYRKQARPQPGSLLDVVSRLASRGVPRESVEAAASAVLVESVFTAHPTEVVRRSLLKKDQRLARVLVERFRTERSDPAGTERLDEAAALELATAWQTEEQLPGRPTVADEVEHVLFFLSDVLYRVVPFIHEELERAMRSVYGEAGAVERPVLRFSSWVGGDMDGNPNVDAGTIRATLERHQELALRRYREELRGLHEHLSQSTTRVRVASALTERVRRYEELMPDAADAIPARYAAMPYRRLLWQMTARLEAKRSGAPHGYGTPTEFVDDLELLARSLEEHGGAQAGAALVRRALIRVRTFGFHLAALDVRQDAQVHRVAIGELLGIDGFDSWTAAERTARLKEALDTAPRRPELPTGKATLDSTLEVFRALRDVRARFGDGAVGPAIISMAQGTDDALAVLVLARAADCVDEEGRVPLDVVPLFETVEDLAAGPGVLRELATDRAYSEHLSARGRRQMVMLGYSDSNKDGGIAASRAGILEAQTRLVAAADELGVELTFFHGRGGSISRGGSKTRAGILATPAGALAGHARATEQGEIIGSKFGLRGIASRTLELALGALLERTADPELDVVPTDEQRAMLATLASSSRARYRALVHDDPDFPAFFRDMTPIDVIERMEIGSRPSRRRQMRGVQDLRAIPWVFSWTQTRAVLPGWFGTGTGLQTAIETHGIETVRRAARSWPFLSTFIADVEMVLAKSDLGIAERYAALAGDVGTRLFADLVDEHARAVAAIEEVTESRYLLERDPTLARSIRLRNPYVDPISLVQVDALERWRAGGREDPELERLLIQCVRGIARGLRNTG